MATKAARKIVKRVPNAVLYSDGTIRIENVRASYPHLFKPYKGDDDNATSYSVVAPMPKKTHGAAKDLLKEQIAEVIKEKWRARLKTCPPTASASATATTPARRTMRACSPSRAARLSA